MTATTCAEPRPSRSSPLRHWAAALLACAALAGCGRAEEQAFERAKATDTVVGWEDFLRQHPEGEPALQARARLNELYEDREWQRAEATNTVPGYQQYLRSYPNGRLANEALVRIANLNLAQTPGDTPPEDASTAAEAAAVLPPADPEASPAARPQPAAAANPPAPASTPKAAPRAEAQPQSKPVAPKPAPKPTPPKAATTPKPAPPAVRIAPPPGKADRGAWQVQLGAFSRGRAAAEAQWATLGTKVPGALRGLSPDISSPAAGKGLHKLRVTGLSEARARSVCAAVTAAGQPCVVVAPP